MPKIDSSGKDYFMGADQLAQSMIFLTLYYYKYWYTGIGMTALSLAYYGPMTLGGPMSAMFAAMTMI